jgi:hypothetical protein
MVTVLSTVTTRIVAVMVTEVAAAMLRGTPHSCFSQIAATYAILGPTPHWGPGGQEVAWLDWKFNRWSGIVVARLDGEPHPAGDPCAGETSCLLFEDTPNLEAFAFLDWGVPACIAGSNFNDRFIAFLGRGYIRDPDQFDFDVFLINRDNPAGLINITDTQGEGLNALTWSGDGQRIAVHAVAEPPDEWPVNSYIAIIDVCGEGFPRTAVPLPPNHPVQNVQFLDWGTNFGVDYILVTTFGGVWIVEVVTGTTAPTPIQIMTTDNQFNDPNQAVWSPDGTMMAIAHTDSDGSAVVTILDVTDVFNPLLVRTIHPTKRAGRIDWRLEDGP